jgi:hypothetical protein
LFYSFWLPNHVFMFSFSFSFDQDLFILNFIHNFTLGFINVRASFEWNSLKSIKFIKFI